MVAKIIRRSPPPPKILGQNAKNNHQGDPNEPPIADPAARQVGPQETRSFGSRLWR